MSNLLYYLLVFIIWLNSDIVLAVRIKESPLRLIIKENQNEKSPRINETLKKLRVLVQDMEKISRSYDSINKKAYWENEAKMILLKALKADGYYNAKIETDFEEKNNKIIFTISDWQRYTIKKVEIKISDNSLNKEIIIPPITELKLKEGDFALAGKILEVGKAIEQYIENNNCVLTIKVKHEAFIDELNNTISVVYYIEAGTTAYVNNVIFTGLTNIEPNYAAKLVKVKNGQCFRRSELAIAEKELQKSSLFAIAEAEISEKDKPATIIFKTKERKHKTIKFGVSYGSNLGTGGTIGWEHRNVFHNGESLKFDSFLNKKEQTLDLAFTKPFFLVDNQTLKINLGGENTVSKAFNNKEVWLSAGIEKKINTALTIGYTGKYSNSRVKDSTTKYFSFISTPIFVKLDQRDNIFNPTEGYKVIYHLEPFSSLDRKKIFFVKNDITGYKILSTDSKRLGLTLKLSAGTINKSNLKGIPANERFYVGGENSVRGYAAQMAGGLDKKNKPTGGLSYLEGGIEAAIRLKSKFGIVGFFEAGSSFSKMVPALNTKYFQGYGLGGRYYTDFGSLKFDIAFPTKKRNKIDDPFQLYFGIEQTL